MTDPTPNPPELLAVEQCDRIAAAPSFPRISRVGALIGTYDSDGRVQAFARHRLSERERAAGIAEAWKSPLRPGTDARLLGHQEAARAIATAIRTDTAGSDGWEPIETAPRDGAWLWLYYPDACPEDRQVVGRWEIETADGSRWMDHADAYMSDPTHWRPLPAPPRTGED